MKDTSSLASTPLLWDAFQCCPFAGKGGKPGEVLMKVKGLVARSHMLFSFWEGDAAYRLEGLLWKVEQSGTYTVF